MMETETETKRWLLNPPYTAGCPEDYCVTKCCLRFISQFSFDIQGSLSLLRLCRLEEREREDLILEE
jgi:hypothetical protein